MNTLEFLVQNLARKSEAQSYKAGVLNASGTEGLSDADGESSFGTLLNALSAKGDGVDMLLRPDGSRSDQKEPVEKRLGLLKDPASTEVPLASEEANVETLAQGIFPLLVQTQQQASTMHGALSSVAYGSGSPPYMAKGENEGAKGIEGAEEILSLKVKVLHQEAHFKPVVTNALSQGSMIGAGAPLSDKQFASLIPLQSEGSGIVAQDNPDTVETLSNAKASSSVAKTSEIDLRSTTGESIFHQLANAIAKEAINSPRQQAQDVTEISQPSANIVLKPSENALRVLSIQLHPVELGVVIVKMRLSGDQLEMELHAHNEETADLLRKDAEKLSGLLRTTGYRADIVTVHTTRTEMLQQETPARQNDSWASQPQSGGSQQGQAGQQGSARQSSTDMDELKHRVRGHVESERSAESHSGGIYL
jgi:Flagellar hook-length control protein